MSPTGANLRTQILSDRSLGVVNCPHICLSFINRHTASAIYMLEAMVCYRRLTLYFHLSRCTFVERETPTNGLYLVGVLKLAGDSPPIVLQRVTASFRMLFYGVKPKSVSPIVTAVLKPRIYLEPCPKTV